MITIENYFLDDLEIVEEKLDNINGVRGTEFELCIFCGANKYNENGIIHSLYCPLSDLRCIIEALKRKKEADLK